MKLDSQLKSSKEDQVAAALSLCDDCIGWCSACMGCSGSCFGGCSGCSGCSGGLAINNE